jgi:hypothetical protein
MYIGDSSYLRANALKGRRFKSLAEENLFLACWESQVADKRQALIGVSQSVPSSSLSDTNIKS